MAMVFPFFLAGALIVGGAVGLGVGAAAGYYYARGYYPYYPYPMATYPQYYSAPPMYARPVYYPGYW